MNIDKGVVTWSGFSGAPGYSVFYARPAGSFMTHLRTFYDSLKTYFPNTVRLSFPSSGDTIDDATGDLVGSWTGPVLSDVVGPAGANYSAPSGVSITWNTNDIVPVGPGSLTAHRLRGRTYLVPLTALSFGGDGTIDDPVKTAITNAANLLITNGAAHFCIWHRPPAGASSGMNGLVLSCSIKDRASVLTSRRA